MRKLSLAELGRMSIEEHRQSKKLPVVVVLDNLRSQHNIGSIFRTADAFRLESVYLCGISATPPNREMHKTALGATESVDWKYFESTVEIVEKLKNAGYTIISIEQTEGSFTLKDFDLQGFNKIAIVFGNEVDGVSQDVVDRSDYCVEIPQYGTKHSLNVAVSAGIIIWEFANQYLKFNANIFDSIKH